jgi:DNA-binding SARP family transcriptional activator
MSVRWGPVPVVMPTTGSRSLLALLALRPGIEYRESVATDLWPERGARSAAALRQALWQLRGGLANVGADPDAVIDASDELIGLVDERVDVDAARFERLLRGRPPVVEEAVALYRGDLCVSPKLDFFARERERLADLFEDALAELARHRLRAGDYDGARNAATALLDRDALREEGHAILIELYGHAGSRSQVARQYRRLRDLLADELDVTPLPETEATYNAALLATYERSSAAVNGAASR